MQRSLLTLVGLPVLTAVVGWTAASYVNDPADAQETVPVSSVVTDEVRRMVLESSIVARGDVQQQDSHVVHLSGDVHLDRNDGSQPVYTGRLVPVDEQVRPGDVIAEIAGRPVIAIPGQIPMYRSLGPGSVGDDVTQLERALAGLGHFEHEPDEVYDQQTEAAVESLYESIGYTPAVRDSVAATPLDEADDAVSSARAALRQAQLAREQADVEPTEGQVMAAEAAIFDAERTLQEAREIGDEATIARAEAGLVLAREELDRLLTPPDLSTHDEAISLARAELARANERRDRIATMTGVSVPRGELTVVPDLPRRVSAVEASVGQTPGADAFTLTDERAEVTVTLPRNEAALVETGQTAVLLDDVTGIDGGGTVTDVSSPPGDAGTAVVTIEPEDDLSDAVGANIQVRIPVTSTDGEVLAVSVAAIHTDAEGRTFVDVVTDLTPGAEVVEPVEVSLGLTAASMVEVVPMGEELDVGDRVAVGHR